MDRGLYGLCIERDEFFGYIDTNQASRPTATMTGWLNELGIGHVRVNIPPFYGSNASAWYDQCWGFLAAYGEQTGIKITVLIGAGWWASDVNKAAYLAAFRSKVSQYKGRIHYYELGNEMDLAFRDKGITPAQYKQWLTDMSAVVRQEDPSARIIMTSFAGATRNGKTYGYMQDVLALGCGNLVDYYSIHTYSHVGPSNPSAEDLRTLITNVAGFVQAAGAPRKPLLFTEAGYGLFGKYAQSFADEGYQLRWNTQRLMRLWAKDIADIYPVERIDTFILRDYAAENNGQGLMDANFVKRLQYHGLKTAFSVLDGAIFLRERSLSGSKCYEYLKENGKKIAVAWSTNSSTRTAAIPAGSASAAVLDNGGAMVGTFTNPVTVSMSYNNNQRYMVSGNASYWREGENYSSANYAPTSASQAQCYNSRHLSLQTTASGDRYHFYNFHLAKAGSYSVYIAATPPNANWASRYQYGLNAGNSYDGKALRASQTLATPTGIPYGPAIGTTRAIGWTHLGDFTMPAGPATFTVRVNTPRSVDNLTHVFYLDAVYLEQQSAPASPPPGLQSVVSRKSHGPAGPLDLALTGAAAVSDIEPRAGGPQQLVFTFDQTVSSGTVSVIGGAAAVSGAPGFSGNKLTVNLSGVANRQVVTLALTNIRGTSGTYSGTFSFRVLQGDVNGDRMVNMADQAMASTANGQAANGDNVRSDINCDGIITAADLILVRNASPSSVP